MDSTEYISNVISILFAFILIKCELFSKICKLFYHRIRESILCILDPKVQNPFYSKIKKIQIKHFLIIISLHNINMEIFLNQGNIN